MMEIPKQLHVDGGQIGGALTVVLNSMFVFNFITFINTSALIYSNYLKWYISPLVCIVLIAVCSVVWWAIYYFVLYPSIMQFNNKQCYIHENPMISDLNEIKESLIMIEEKLSKL
jgi:phosphotransferase system  glucose/maltose/N-acetylglucosamine-specific IIC component